MLNMPKTTGPFATLMVQIEVQWSENRRDEQKLEDIFENNFKNVPFMGLNSVFRRPRLL